MSRNIWLISDTHFNHANILHFKDSRTGNLVRPGFESLDAMNEHMIERWNSVVKPGDKVYHLGDVVMGKNQKDWMSKNWSRLVGRKVLVCGNHDPIKLLSSGGWFSSIYESRDLRELGLLLTHRPAHESQLWDYKRDKPMLNVHGHLHQNPSPPGPYTSVCVELREYTPVHIEDLALEAKALL